MNLKSKRLRHAIVLAGCLGLGAPLLAQVGGPTTAPATTQQAVDPNKVIISFGTEKITAQQFEDFLADLPPEVQAMARGPAKRQIAEKLVELRLLDAEARKRGLDKSPKFTRQMQLVQMQVLATMLMTDLQKPDDAEMQKYYEQHKSEYETATARHILIRMKGSQVPLEEGQKDLTDEEAKAKAEAIRKRLAGGEDFAAIAKAESDDKGSGGNGGALPSFHRGEWNNPAFEDATFALKPGEISQPVKTSFGYHIIQLEQKKSPTFEEAKPQIEQKLPAEKAKQLLDDLKKASNTTLDEAFFGPPRPAGMPGMPPGMEP